MKVIWACEGMSHYEYARVEATNFEWVKAKVQFFQKMNLRTTITLIVDGVRALVIHVLKDGHLEFDNVEDLYPDLADEVVYYVLHGA